MGVMLQHVQMLPSGRLQYRRAFPHDLRRFTGRGEFIRSLKGRSMGEPDAMERYRNASAEYDRLTAVARKAGAGQYDVLTSEHLDWLVAGYVHARLAHDDDTRFDRGDRRFELEAMPSFRAAPMGFMDGASRKEKALAGLPIVIADLKDAYAGGDPDRIIQIEGQNAEDLAADHSLRLELAGETFAALCRKLLVADIGVAEKLLARFKGEPVATPSPPSKTGQNESSFAPHAPKVGRGFITLAEEELNRPSFEAGESTKEANRTALRLFRELHGDLPPEQITRAHAKDYIDALTRRPVVRGKEAKLSLSKLEKRYADKDVPRLSPKTRAAHLGSLQALWNKLQAAGQIDEARLNPFAKHKLGKPPISRKAKDFSKAEMGAMFALPVFTEGERPTSCREDAAYWIPLMMAATGARPEEIAQLILDDIERSAEDEWTLTITDEGRHAHKGPRRLKTRTGHRTFPVPQVLIELGLPRYVAWLRERGEAVLFPALRTKGKRRLLFSSFGDWWRAYLRQHGAYPDDRRGGRDFRQTWATIARQSAVPREAQEYIMGHYEQAQRMNSTYGDLRPLGNYTRQVSFDGWGFEKVQPWVNVS